MKTKNLLTLLVSTALLFGFTSVYSQGAEDDPANDSANDQADVWAMIEAVWNADEKGDKKWPDRFLADDFSGWAKNAPAPSDKSSIKSWDRFNDQLGKLVAHELYPLSIIVNNDIAVVHYLYRSAFEPKDGDIKMSNGRYTDVLVRTEDGWKFIAWHGGSDGK